MKQGSALSFKGGTLTVLRSGYGAKDGSGTIAFFEGDLEFEFDRSDLATRWIAIPHSELIAIRDFLNKEFPAPLTSPQQTGLGQKP